MVSPSTQSASQVVLNMKICLNGHSRLILYYKYGHEPIVFSSSARNYRGWGVFYEHKSQGLISRRQFLFRLLRHFFLAFAVFVITLSVGFVGYLCWGDRK